jgi:hypothetical protein
MATHLEEKSAFHVGLRDLKIEFTRNNSILRKITDTQARPDLQRYLHEINSLVRWYFDNPVKEFWQKHPERKDAERIIKKYRQLATTEGPAQKNAQRNLPIREESYRLSRSIFDQLVTGKYTAIASAFDRSLRFDIHSVEKKNNRLHWNFVAWSGLGNLVFENCSIKMYKSPDEKELSRYLKAQAKAEKWGKIVRQKDPRAMHFAEASNKNPKLPLFEGSDYIDEFPAGANINYYVTPVCAPESEEIEVSFQVKIRILSGDAQRFTFSFRLSVKENWKGDWQGVRSVEASETYE